MNEDTAASLADDRSVPTGRSAVLGIAIGTIVMGLSGFVVLIVTAADFGAENYALFGVFWSALYFVVVVVTGAQHEATRASLAPLTRPGASLLVFGATLAFVVFVVVTGSSLWWSGAAFGDGHRQLGILVGLGGAGFALNCVFAGALAGAGAWKAFAALLFVEGVVRAVAVGLVLVVAADVEAAAWAVVLTYPLTFALIWVTARGRRVDLVHVSGSLRQLWANTAKTMTASAGVGALITGFPVLMSATSRDETPTVLGALTLAVMLTRAPLLVPLTGMQSFLVSVFSTPGVLPWRLLGRLLAAATMVALVLSAVAGLVGDQVLSAVFGEDFSVGSATLALLVASSGCLAAMTLVAPALIARGALGGNAVAWAVASGLAIVVLVATPCGLGLRAGVSLVIGPAVGVVIQLVSLRRHLMVDP